MQRACQELGIQLQSLEMSEPSELDSLFDTALRGRIEALVTLHSSIALDSA